MNLKKKYSVKTKGTLKPLELTDEQYRRLLLIINLGKRTIIKDDDGLDVELIDIEQYVQSFAPLFNSKDLVEYDIERDFYFETNQLKNRSREVMDYYDDSTFRFELTKRLAQRDVKLLEKTQPKKDVDEIEEIELKYLDEFIKNDVTNLQLIKPNNDEN